MLFSAIAWTADGYDVEVVDPDGRRVRPARSFPAAEIGRIAGYLGELAAGCGRPVSTVIDSTNGVLDGLLIAAGLDVYRADPWHLPGAPSSAPGGSARFGSVPAAALAQIARTRLDSLSRLQPEIGTLTGRGAESIAAKAASDRAESASPSGWGCLRNGPRSAAEVALTFDDGPNPPFTDQILDILARYEVSASFFCIGLHARAWPDQISRIRENGHTVANHTWSHPYLPDLNRAQLIEQIERTDAAITRSGAGVKAFFRPPYGSRSPAVLSWLQQQGAPVVLWDVDPHDWARPGSTAISDAALRQARPGSIILLHDGGGDRTQTVAALPAIIEGLLERNYQLVPVDRFASETRAMEG